MLSNRKLTLDTWAFNTCRITFTFLFLFLILNSFLYNSYLIFTSWCQFDLIPTRETTNNLINHSWTIETVQHSLRTCHYSVSHNIFKITDHSYIIVLLMFDPWCECVMFTCSVSQCNWVHHYCTLLYTSTSVLLSFTSSTLSDNPKLSNTRKIDTSLKIFFCDDS